MSKKAEERAKEFEDTLDYHQSMSMWPEDAFRKGYEQAEKDLAMTIDDLERLHTFLYAVKNNKQGCFTFTRLSDEQYQEVLRRFNESRK